MFDKRSVAVLYTQSIYYIFLYAFRITHSYLYMYIELYIQERIHESVSRRESAVYLLVDLSTALILGAAKKRKSNSYGMDVGIRIP